MYICQPHRPLRVSPPSHWSCGTYLLYQPIIAHQVHPPFMVRYHAITWKCLTSSILWEWDIQPYWEWPVLLCQTRLINTSTNSKVDWCIHLSRMMSWPRGPFKKSIITVHFIVVIQRDIIRSVKLTNCPNEGLYKIDQYSPWNNQLLIYSVKYYRLSVSNYCL